MTAKQFFDWQTAGGTDDVMRLVDSLEGVHGILLRVASLDDTLRGKIKAWSDEQRRRSKQIKDLADIARLIEAHPELSTGLPEALNSSCASRSAERAWHS